MVKQQGNGNGGVGGVTWLSATLSRSRCNAAWRAGSLCGLYRSISFAAAVRLRSTAAATSAAVSSIAHVASASHGSLHACKRDGTHRVNNRDHTR